MSEQSFQQRICVRFGAFEADLQSGELRKLGVRIKLQTQPFKLLTALLLKPGEIVSRDELRQFIWGSETIVDFDHSLGTAVRKIREALDDSADTPRYIETLARRGYRFIAPVVELEQGEGEPAVPNRAPDAIHSAPLECEPDSAVSLIPAEKRAHSPKSLRFRMTVIGTALALGLSGWMWLSHKPSQTSLIRLSKVSWSNRVYPGDMSLERFPSIATDGVRIYFSELRDGKIVLSYASIANGETYQIITPPEINRPTVADISPDGSKLLIRSLTWSDLEQPLWIVPSTGGGASKVLSGLAHDAVWRPDGDSILYASGRNLFVTHNDGREDFKLATLPGRAYWVRYAPDGSRVRFTVLDPKSRATSLWEIAADGTQLRPLLSGWNTPTAECCGNWTPDGKSFIFQASRDGVSNIWERRESGGLWPTSPEPSQITAGPLDFLAPSPSRTGDRIFVIGTHQRRQLFRFDQKLRQFEPYLPNITIAGRNDLSLQSGRVAWISTTDGTLWRSNVDGTQRLQLTPPPMRVHMMRWSPDGSKIAFMGIAPGAPWKIYVISANGGRSLIVHDEASSQADPNWSPDGRSIVFGRPPDYMSEDSTAKAIYTTNLETKTLSTLPESAGLFSPRWSPNGRYFAAMPLDQRNLMLYDTATKKWTTLVTRSVHNPVWSRDSKYIFFQAFLENDKPICRISISDQRLEVIADSRGLDPADTLDYQGLDLDNVPVVSLRYFSADIYAIDSRRR